MTPETTDDAFLGGRLRLLQPARGYRAGTDPVLLASAVPAKPGQTVLDLGCGVGTALYCLGARVAGLSLFGVEFDAETADLARRNAERNGLRAEIHTADVASLPADLRATAFDHAIANPPYFDADRRMAAADAKRERALAGASLATWCETALRRLAPRGWFTLIIDAAGLPEILKALDGRVGNTEVLPITSREGRPASRVILRTRKGGRAPFRLHAPTILHAGEKHAGDGDSYLPEISAVLRDGAPFPTCG